MFAPVTLSLISQTFLLVVNYRSCGGSRCLAQGKCLERTLCNSVWSAHSSLPWTYWFHWWRSSWASVQSCHCHSFCFFTPSTKCLYYLLVTALAYDQYQRICYVIFHRFPISSYPLRRSSHPAPLDILPFSPPTPHPNSFPLASPLLDSFTPGPSLWGCGLACLFRCLVTTNTHTL